MTHESQTTSSGSAPAGSELLELILGLPAPRWDEPMDYLALGVERAHESDLIAIATNPALRRADVHTAESWAPVHAVRSLAELRSERAVGPVLDVLASGGMDDDWMARELPALFGAIGSPALEPLIEFAGDRSRDVFARMVTVEALGEIGSRREPDRRASVDGLTRLLEGFADDDPSFNAMIIGELVDLGAREAASIMEAAFDADCVDLMHVGDWEDVQIELGLLTERITPRRPLGGWASARTSDRKFLSGHRNLDASVAEILERVLRRPGRTWGPKTPRELEGFLFAVACAPDLVPPSQWLEALFEDDEPFEDEADARAALGAFIELYRIIQDDVNEPLLEAPEGLFRDDLMANLEEDAEVGQWSRGFVIGHSWLEELWDVSGELEAMVDRELGALMFTLSFFARRSLAEQYLQEFGGAKSLSELAETVRKYWSGALVEYAELGRTLLKAQMEEQESRPLPVRAAPRPGRNDPCSCGSGRKYKKCCGRGEA